MRSTGGNQFIAKDAGPDELLRAIEDGIWRLRRYAGQTGRELDPGAITVTTKRTNDGRVSVDVSGDLTVAAARSATKEPLERGDG